MYETTGELPVGGQERRLNLHTADGRVQDITDFLQYTEDPDMLAFRSAPVLLDFAAMQDGEGQVLECEDVVQGIPPYQIIFEKEGGRIFAIFASPGVDGPAPEFEVRPIAGAMTLDGHSVWEDGPPRIKEGFYLVLDAREDGNYCSLRLGPFVDPWSELQLGIHGLAAASPDSGPRS